MIYRFRFANAEFDEARSVLLVSGQQVAVERLPLQLLALLLRRVDETVPRAELLETLWRGRPTVDHVLASTVSKLRRALGVEAAARIANLPRVGYRLTGPIERLAVGRRPIGEFNLSEGDIVPGQEHFVLVRRLGDDIASNVWLVRHKRLDEMRVLKFARDGDRLSALKREFTVCRLLQRELGPRSDLVSIKDNNFSSAPFFLAYEYAGDDLRAWARGQPHLGEMLLEDRLLLFLKIARAVAAAHSVGVLHRDLKPSNVLIEACAPAAEHAGVSAQPEVGWHVRLTDFGSSHLLTPERLAALGVTALGMTVNTASHPLIGSTPQYIAPELLAGVSPTTQSDLYALGLILYQLLAADLSRPLATGWERDVPDPLLADDVRAATEGRPEQRLASVAQLIERLETLPQRRARCDEIAQTAAKMQLAAERLQSIRRRRPWVLALAVCIALGGIGATWFGVQARAAQHVAERASVRAQAINDFLNIDVLWSADSTLSGAAVPNVPLIDVLGRASDRVSGRFRDDPPVLARVLRQLGDIYLSMSFADRAEQEFERAITALEPVVAADDPELLASRFGLAQALAVTERPTLAAAKLEAAERVAGPALLSGSSQLLQRALRARIRVLMEQQRYDEALPLARRLVQVCDTHEEHGETDLGRRLEAREWLAEISEQTNDATNTARIIEELKSPPFNKRTVAADIFARVQLQRAKQHLQQGRLTEAETMLIALRDTARAELRPNQLDVGLLHGALFEVFYRQGRFKLALDTSESALRAFRATLGDRHGLVTMARIQAALSKLEIGLAGEALRELEAARLRLDANGRHIDRLMDIDLGRVRALEMLGRRSEALALLRAMQPPAGESTAAWVFEMQAEKGRILLDAGILEPGRAAVTGAINSLQQAKAPAWRISRYQALLATGAAN